MHSFLSEPPEPGKKGSFVSHDCYLRACKEFLICNRRVGLVFYYLYSGEPGPDIKSPQLIAVVSLWDDALRPLDALVKTEGDYKVCQKHFPFGYSLVLRGMREDYSQGFLGKLHDVDTGAKRWMLVVPTTDIFDVVEDAVTAVSGDANKCNIATQRLLSHSMTFLEEYLGGNISNAISELLTGG